MEREAKSNREVYQSLLTREKELRVSANSRTNNVRVIDHAEMPKAPITPGGRRTWLISIVVGLVLSVAVALGLDYMNDTIKTPEDVTRRLKLPFLGLVPSVRGDKHPLLASSHVPHDFGESFRALRTSLLSKYPGEGTKIFIVTSAQPLEGKTTTAANIAMALAYGGSRVLLIDADMRRPGLHRPLRLTNERGLSQVLIGQARVRDVIQRTVDPNLLAITAGRTPPNPSELLSSERMKTLLTNLAHGPFDWIIIDTPPVLAVTDAVILAPMVNGVTFVIGAEMTRRRLAERAIETVMQSRPRYAAVVLNKVDFAKNKYYYSRYYGHQYQELLRRSGALIVRPRPSPFSFSSAGPWSRSPARIAGRSCRLCAGVASFCSCPSGRGSAAGRARCSTGRSSRASPVVAAQLIPLPCTAVGGAVAARGRGRSRASPRRHAAGAGGTSAVAGSECDGVGPGAGRRVRRRCSGAPAPSSRAAASG